ncbi:hypothetical protein L9F63_022766, partial [Diploptera punctata]
VVTKITEVVLSLRILDETKSSTTIGFIGLGNMGCPMARNIIAKVLYLFTYSLILRNREGHNVVVYDIRQECVTELAEEGATTASSPLQVASEVQYLITMLPDNATVRETYQGDNGILKSVKKGTMLIDSSTIDPELSKYVGKLAEEKGAIFFDAPVSGGVNAAREAKLTFMVGGPEKYFPTAQDLLFTTGARIVHCGSVGSGQTAKLCNNMLLAVSMIGTAEAMNLGIRLGLDPKLLMSVFNSSTGRCWSSELYNPVPGTMENVPSCNNYEGGFLTRLMFKDLTLAQDMAARTTTKTPLGSSAHKVYSKMLNNGFAEKDFSSVYQFLKQQSPQILCVTESI